MKKVLFLTYDFPFPTNTGGKNRAYHMLKYSGKDFKKYLFSFVRNDFDEKYKKELEEIGVEIVGLEKRKKVLHLSNISGFLRGESIFKSIYYSKEVEAKIKKIILDYGIDVVHYESFYTGFYISNEIKSLNVKQVFGTENVEYKLYGDYAKSRGILYPFYSYEVGKIRREEINMYQSADVCVAVSEKDSEEIEKFAKCEIVRNGVDIKDFKFKRQNETAKNILFVGNFTYFPNIDAVNFFYNDVFKQMESDLTFTIIGKKAKELSCATDPRVKTIEFIEDIKDAYNDADVMVAPIRLGGGTNFKVLEAMAAGVPVVALPQRLEGLDVHDGRDIMVARNSQEFKKKLAELIDNKILREELAISARKLAEELYSWEVIGKSLAKTWENL